MFVRVFLFLFSVGNFLKLFTRVWIEIKLNKPPFCCCKRSFVYFAVGGLLLYKTIYYTPSIHLCYIKCKILFYISLFKIIFLTWFIYILIFFIICVYSCKIFYIYLMSGHFFLNPFIVMWYCVNIVTLLQMDINIHPFNNNERIDEFV